MVFGLSHLAYFPFATPEYGSKLVLFLVVLTQLNDVVHYLVSLYLGKRKVVPTANPFLTWEGFACAFVITTAASYFIRPYLTPFDWQFGIFIGVLISLAGFFGSLTVSVLKRDLLIGDDNKFDALKKLSKPSRQPDLYVSGHVSCRTLFLRLHVDQTALNARYILDIMAHENCTSNC